MLDTKFFWQLLRLNEEGQLGFGERCIDMEGTEIKILVCPEAKVNGPWKYDQVGGQFYKVKDSVLH